MKQLILKISLVAFIVTFLIPFIPAKKAEAQFVVEFGPAATGLISSIVAATGTTATATTSTAATTGVIGAGSLTVSAAKAALGATCQTTIVALNASGTLETLLDSTSSAALDVIGGGPAELTQIGVRIAKATAAKVCVDSYVELLSAAPGVTLQNGSELAREQDKYTKISATLSQTIEDLSARQNASVKDILKAFMVKVILNLNKNLTTQFVNKLVEKYKISDYLKYGDALASQVYSMKYINENYTGDVREQMMIRSLLQSEKLPEKIKTVNSLATSTVQEYLGKACDISSTSTIVQSDASFSKCLAAYGSAQANPTYHILQSYDKAQAASASGKVTAASEISQSNGYAPPRDCKGSLSFQKQIDGQFDKVALDKTVALATLAKLKTALNFKPPQTTQAEVDRAQAAADQAIANAKALETQTKNPIIDICEAIDSPASFVSTGIGDFLKQHVDQGSRLESNNLPFYATFLADVTSNFLTNILTGGKSTSQVLKEAGTAALSGASIALGQTGTVPTSMPGGSTGGGNGGGTTTTPPAAAISITASPANAPATQVTALTPGQSYVFTVNFASISAQRPTYIEVNGASPQIRRNLTTSEISANRVTFTFTATASPITLDIGMYRSADSVSVVLIERYSKSFTVAGQVNSANIVLPRGPALSLR